MNPVAFVAGILAAWACVMVSSACEIAPPGVAMAFSELPGFAADDHLAALRVLQASCVALAARASAVRAAQPPPPALRGACAASGAATTENAARAFFETRFTPRRLPKQAFFTGYYEPVVEGSLARGDNFTVPLLARPPDLVVGEPGRPLPGLDPTFSAGRRRADGTLAPMPDRAAIEAGALGPDAPSLVWLRDPVDAFFVHVQGSARVRLPDGSLRRLAYAGRNGYPYTSIGKLLVKRLGIAPDKMGMAELAAWIRANGEASDQAGGKLMAENRSYIFFRFDDALPPEAGPIGGEGVSLAPLRSLAVDRSIWSYGLPFYVAAALPWHDATPTPFRRLLVAQDTGSAIVGEARADIFFGTGPDAADAAGRIRQPGTLYVLWPKDPP